MEPVGRVIFHLLTGDPTVRAIVGTRVYPILAAQSAGDPYIVYNIDGVIIPETKDKPSQHTYLMTVDFYDNYDNHDRLEDLALAGLNALDRATPRVINGVDMDGIEFIDGRGGTDDKGDKRAYMTEYSIRVNRNCNE